MATEVELSIYKPGVYGIRHIVSSKTYVGSCTSTIKKRWRQHRYTLVNGTHRNRYLQRAWNRHGPDAFEWVVLENCLPIMCVSREQHWIDKINSANSRYGYNISPNAGNQLGYKHTAETRAKISAKGKGIKRTEEFKAGVKRFHTGKKHTEESKKKMSSARKGKPSNWLGKNHSEDTKRKMSVNNPMRNQEVVEKNRISRIENRKRLQENIASHIPEAKRFDF